MAAGSTYTPIATTTLGSAQSSVTFNSFSGYTDLRLIVNATGSVSNYVKMNFNGDTGANYSFTNVRGSSAAGAASSRSTNESLIWLDGGWLQISTTDPALFTVDIMNYFNSTTYKSVLSRANIIKGADTLVGATVALWRNTSAITSLIIAVNTGNFNTGSTFTLYGIAAA
jgi:hypothetical protein